LQGLFAFKYGDKSKETIIFHPEDTIISYNGEHVTQKQLNHRYGKMTGPYAACYVEKGRSKFCVDSACLRGTGAFINSPSSSKFKSNAYMEFDTKQKKFFIVAKKHIKNGEEIFWNYNTSVTPNNKTYNFNEPNVTSSTKPYYSKKKS
jgi:hypothetical protein